MLHVLGHIKVFERKLEMFYKDPKKNKLKLFSSLEKHLALGFANENVGGKELYLASIRSS